MGGDRDSPADGQEYEASEELQFLGWASDLEDGSFPA